ncbi:MAG TPA: TonB-dependent receptor [Longimicrobiales bacterium]
MRLRLRFALTLGCCLAAAGTLAAQAPAHVTLAVSAEGRPLPGAEVRSGGVLVLSDSAGRARLALSPGPRRLLVWKPGYAVDSLALVLRAGADTSIAVELTVVAQEEPPIVVHAARSEVRIEQEPTRVEVLAPEDVEEKSLTRPGDMTNLLVEMGGIHVQPVAPGLGGATIRVQGLPGRYTLLLTDGLPLQGAHAPAFSLVQAPPLDLRQVEVIKGAATALYGPSALGGVVDLISRSPADQRQVLLSQTTLGGTDGLLWLSRKASERWGYTFLGGAHRQARQDVDGDGWTDVAGYERVEARPRLFWASPAGSSLLLTTGGIAEDRRGGTVPAALLPGGIAFPDRLKTAHGDVGAVGHLVLTPATLLGVRASAMLTHHERTLGDDAETDSRRNAFAEATLSLARSRNTAVLGVSGEYDGLRVTPRDTFSYGFGTVSAFAEDTYTPVDPLALEASLRLDRHSRYGTFLSPRVSALGRLGDDWSVRLSGGTGFFAPTPLLPEVEEVGFAHLLPLRPLAAEHGASVSLDVGGEVGPFQLNGTAFAVRVDRPVLAVHVPTPFARVPVPADAIPFQLVNAQGPIRSAGLELFAVYAREPLLVTATFSHQQATELSPDEPGRSELPLTPRNAGGVDLAWEEDEAGARVALEVFYTGRQRVEDDPYRTFTPGFATVELLAAKRFGRFELFANGENLTNVRQTHWDPLLLPSPGLGGRWTTDEWAPLEGRVLNAGVRVAF